MPRRASLCVRLCKQFCGLFKNPKPTRKYISAKVVHEVFHRCQGHCFYCYSTIEKIKPRKNIYEIDHLEAFSKAGTDDISNYYVACYKCNKSKGNKQLSAFLEKHGHPKRCQHLNVATNQYCMQICSTLISTHCNEHTSNAL
jgi:5-methylcytosine-specific restriction endonuclease McrA